MMNDPNLSSRAKVLAATSTSPDTNTSPTPPPRRHRVADFLYHRKFQIAVAIFIIILATFSIWSHLSRGGSSDVTVMYAGPCELFAAQGDSITSAIRSVRREESEENVELADIVWYSPRDKEALGDMYTVREDLNSKALMQFREEITSGDTLLFMLSPELYGEIKESLVPLGEIFESTPPCAADEYSVKLGDTDFYKFFTAVQVLPEDTRLCLRRAAELDVYSADRGAEAEEICGNLLRDIVGFEMPIG